MAGVRLQILPEYWNIVKFWFLSSLSGKQVRLCRGLLMLQKTDSIIYVCNTSKYIWQWEKSVTKYVQHELQRTATLAENLSKWQINQNSKYSSIPSGWEGELFVVGFFWSAAKWRTGYSINHLHSFWSRPRAGSPGGALTAHGVHPRVGAV